MTLYSLRDPFSVAPTGGISVDFFSHALTDMFKFSA